MVLEAQSFKCRLVEWKAVSDEEPVDRATFDNGLEIRLKVIGRKHKGFVHNPHAL